jgi:hypothetical protein
MDTGADEFARGAVRLRGGWWGLVGEHYDRRLRIGREEILSGVPGSTEHHAAPYAMTEEFVSVYRLHSLPRTILVPPTHR